MAREGIRMLVNELERSGARLLLADRTRNSLFRHVFRTKAHGQAFAKGARLEQLGDADLVSARRALEHALGRRALE